MKEDFPVKEVEDTKSFAGLNMMKASMESQELEDAKGINDPKNYNFCR